MTPALRRSLPWALPVLCLLSLVASFRTEGRADVMDVAAFARLPVLAGGRIKPLDTVARTSLLMTRGKQTVAAPGGRRLSAAEWLLDLAARPDVAERYPVFTVDDPGVLGATGLGTSSERYFSVRDLEPKFGEIDRLATEADPVAAQSRTRFQSAVVNLRDRILLCQRLENTFQPAAGEGFPAEIADYTKRLPGIAHGVKAHLSSAGLDRKALAAIAPFFKRYQAMAQMAEFRPLPPRDGESDDGWSSPGEGLLEGLHTGVPHPSVAVYADLLAAWKAGDAATFNARAAELTRWLADHRPHALRMARDEELFNRVAPFAQGMAWYLLALVCAFTAYLAWPDTLRSTAFRLLALGWLVHTAGLGSRIVLQGRPPVTNLYSSAVFVGWVAVGLGLWLEWRARTGVATIAAGAIGFVTLIIAHHLALTGDSMEMMRAVLDSNFWLATHVVAVTVGYASTFLAGAIGIWAVGRAVWGRADAAEEASLARMAYGVVCFALFFSFTGTVLGGIWADQSWGRFWGWDPKENGALLIVLWNAIILHVRAGRLGGDRGLLVMAVAGNIVTALSWFGVNMLGIGLHSYGFMEQAFWWLTAFCVSQAAVMGVGMWRPRS